MAVPFEAQQRFSQDREGKTLTLIDFSNYNDILPVVGDPYVNSAGNDDGVSVEDFIERRWYLQDIDGLIEEVIFPYDLPQLNKCSIVIDRDKYLTVIMVIKTGVAEYQSTVPLLANRRVEYKLYILSNQESCCNTKITQAKIDAKNLMDTAVFKLKHYDEAGADTDIVAANKLLNSVI